MKIFLDSSNIEEAKRWMPVIDGATTNPLILEKDGSDIYEFAKIMEPKPVSIEACGNFITEAGRYSREIPNAVIKIPLLAPNGGNNIKLIEDLSMQRVIINCTALMSLSQIILAEKVGARYVSLFLGRIDDEGGNPLQMIEDCKNYLTSAELIVGSIRTVGNVLDAVRAGADIVTIPPPILEKMVKHERSLSTVREFEDAHNRLLKGS